MTVKVLNYKIPPMNQWPQNKHDAQVHHKQQYIDFKLTFGTKNSR